MPYFRIIDPKGVNGYSPGVVVEFPVYMGNALRIAGRVEPAREPAPASADRENRRGGYQVLQRQFGAFEAETQTPAAVIDDGMEADDEGVIEDATPQPGDVDDHPDEEPEQFANLEDLTVVELKAELAARDLSRTGNKDELIKRLRDEGV